MAPIFEALETVFHEPNRLAIMTDLCSAPEGRSFAELKQSCSLTDGNLSRHISTLEKAGFVKTEKKFVGLRPRTTVFMTENGREEFLNYLHALEEVLKTSSRVAKIDQKNERRQRAAQVGVSGKLVPVR